jgi:hypothetical protein
MQPHIHSLMRFELRAYAHVLAAVANAVSPIDPLTGYRLAKNASISLSF